MKELTTDQFFLRAVKTGILKVSKTGAVTNTVTGRRIGTGKSDGYYRVGLVEYKADGTKRNRTITVHRLVWLAHKGPIPAGLEVNHKDLNKANNRLSNFELLTGSGNVLHSYRVGNRPKPKGKPNPETAAQYRAWKKSGLRLLAFWRKLPKSRTHYDAMRRRFLRYESSL
jgi:hypothetical protein